MGEVFTLKVMFLLHIDNMTYPGGSRLSRVVFMFAFLLECTRTVREQTKHPLRNICRRQDLLGVASMCAFALALTHCGLMPAIQLRSLPGYMRITRSFLPVTNDGPRSTFRASGTV